MTALPVLAAAARRDAGRRSGFVIAREYRDPVGLFENENEGDNLPGLSENIRPTDAPSVVIDTVRSKRAINPREPAASGRPSAM